MNQWFDLMVDVECFGMPPDGAISTIAACFFDYRAQTIGPTFSRNIHLATAVRDGGQLDAATVLWWLRQSDKARLNTITDSYDNRQVLDEFRAFINEHSREQDAVPWGNSNSFDLTLIARAYERIGQERPWKWNRELDFRTCRNLFPSVVYDPSEKGDDAHTALADAIFQAKHLFKIKHRNSKAAA